MHIIFEDVGTPIDNQKINSASREETDTMTLAYGENSCGSHRQSMGISGNNTYTGPYQNVGFGLGKELSRLSLYSIQFDYQKLHAIMV